MDFESLENMDKSEFLPLGTVKQELLDPANGISDDATKATAENDDVSVATTINDSSDSAETNNPVCDSADKQVREIFLIFFSFIFH